MSTEKCCENCLMYVDFGDFDGCALKEMPCNDLSEWMPSIPIEGSNCPTPAQKHAEELLKALKNQHKYYIESLKNEPMAGAYDSICDDSCSTCQLIAKAEGRE